MIYIDTLACEFTLPVLPMAFIRLHFSKCGCFIFASSIDIHPFKKSQERGVCAFFCQDPTLPWQLCDIFSCDWPFSFTALGLLGFKRSSWLRKQARIRRKAWMACESFLNMAHVTGISSEPWNKGAFASSGLSIGPDYNMNCSHTTCVIRDSYVARNTEVYQQITCDLLSFLRPNSPFSRCY